MKLLLDTHAFLWALDDPGRLSARARQAIVSAPILGVHMVSAWEVSLLQERGRLQLGRPLEALFAQGTAALRARLLPLQLSHLAELRQLPAVHRDPFDRMLVAAARVEGLTLVTKDRALADYDVKTIW